MIDWLLNDDSLEFNNQEQQCRLAEALDDYAPPPNGTPGAAVKHILSQRGAWRKKLCPQSRECWIERRT
jgi:hypothetical protein